jgi:SAM-dependent methyltransferase
MSLPWYQTWFNTPYYHDLYQHRDLTEARGFIESLCQNLGVNEGEIAIDMACGRGRHAQVLANQGLETLGIDLSPESIAFANQFAHEGLEFRVGNMLEPLQAPPVDWVFNLFTSFGYFENNNENIEVLKAGAENLNSKGVFVLDFLNVKKVIPNLVPIETKVLDGVQFDITRTYNGKHIIKDILVKDAAKEFHFQERVSALDLITIQEMATAAGLQIVDIFGNYDLNEFNASNSDRLILIMRT